MTTSVAGIVPQWTMGDRLRKARELTGLDRTTFASELGVSRNTVTSYEADVPTKPRIVVLRSWAMRCGVSQEWLIDGSGDPTPPGTSQDFHPTNPCLSDGLVILGPWVTSIPDTRDVA